MHLNASFTCDEADVGEPHQSENYSPETAMKGPDKARIRDVVFGERFGVRILTRSQRWPCGVFSAYMPVGFKNFVAGVALLRLPAGNCKSSLAPSSPSLNCTLLGGGSMITYLVLHQCKTCSANANQRGSSSTRT